MVVSGASQTTAPRRTALELVANETPGRRVHLLRPSKTGRSLVARRLREEEAGAGARAAVLGTGNAIDAVRRGTAIDSTRWWSRRWRRGTGVVEIQSILC